MSGAPGTEGGARRRCDLSAPPGPALSARERSLLAACPFWRIRCSAPRMHLLAPRALGAKLRCLRRSERRLPPHQQRRGRERGQVEAEGVGVRLDTEETAYFRESATR